MIDHSSEIIDAFIREQAERYGFSSFEACKMIHRIILDFGLLDVREFAKEAGVSEDAVRRYFGDDDVDESEESDDSDNGDETEATTRDATQISRQGINLLEVDSNNILEKADRDYNNRGAYGTTLLLDQLNALNHQLNILTRMFAIYVRNTLKEGED